MLSAHAVPHYAAPSVSRSHLLISYRNFQSHDPRYSHVGLGINAVNTGKVLRENQIRVDVAPIWTADDLTKAVTARPTLTHVLVEAPFIDAGSLLGLANQHTDVQFVSRSHSQVGFLVVEAGAIALFRDYLRMQDSTLNFRAAVNSERLGGFVEQAYRSSALLLPNLYYHARPARKPYHPPGKTIRVGSFGAIRLLKNHITAAAGALILAATTGKDLEFYLSVNREEHGKGVVQSIRNLFAGVPYAKLVELPWQPYAEFRHTVSTMDLHIQVSATETFNICCADAIAEGVPSVTGDCIDWVPSDWIVSIDDANAVARKGIQLLNDPTAARRGLACLEQYTTDGLAKWMAWLGGSPLTSTMTRHPLL